MMSTIVAAKASMVTATEKKRKVKPIMSFRGSAWRKSWRSKGEVRIERNMTTEVNELARERTSMQVKIRKKVSQRRMGVPVS
jgi:hypothetical protein